MVKQTAAKWTTLESLSLLIDVFPAAIKHGWNIVELKVLMGSSFILATPRNECPCFFSKMVLTFTSMMFSSQKQLPGFQRHLFGLLELKNTMMLALFGPGPAGNVDQATTTFWMWKHVSKKTRHLYLQLYILRPWNQCHFGMAISIRAHRSARHFLQSPWFLVFSKLGNAPCGHAVVLERRGPERPFANVLCGKFLHTLKTWSPLARNSWRATCWQWFRSWPKHTYTTVQKNDNCARSTQYEVIEYTYGQIPRFARHTFKIL